MSSHTHLRRTMPAARGRGHRGVALGASINGGPARGLRRLLGGAHAGRPRAGVALPTLRLQLGHGARGEAAGHREGKGEPVLALREAGDDLRGPKGGGGGYGKGWSLVGRARGKARGVELLTTLGLACLRLKASRQTRAQPTLQPSGAAKQVVSAPTASTTAAFVSFSRT
jgi:hypothetical protein